MDEDDDIEVETNIWRNDIRPLKEDEVLEVSPGCYEMLYKITLDWSCLSFDIIKDNLGGCRIEYPHECYVVAGTQPSTKPDDESLIHVMKWSNLMENGGEEEEEEDEDGSIDDVEFKFNSIKHNGLINSVKICPQSTRLICTMSATSNVYIWDINDEYNNLINGSSGNTSCRAPLFINSRHDVEGYAVSWNPYTLGILVSGDCNGEIYLWSPIHGGWELNRFYKTNASIEDVKWQDSNIFSSSSTDGIIRLFDLRCKGVTCEFKVSNVDVNSLSWNPIEKNILLCGDDEGIGKIYDIRHVDNNLAEITWHNNSIISLDWHPNESSVLALCSRDDSISIWDTSIEAQDITNNPNIPQQLMFLHMGQTDITQVMFHQQIPGVIISTALDGLNVFKPINI